MNIYTHTFRLSVPLELADLAAAIGRAMDQDSGGADSFHEVDGVLTCETLCTEGFYLQAQAMLADPTLLHYAVTADYAARWPELVAPTLADCELFVSSVIPEPPKPVLNV